MTSSSPIFKARGYTGFAKGEWLDALGDLDALRTSGIAVVDKPNRMVRRIDTPKGVVFVKWLWCAQGHFARIKSLFCSPRVIRIYKMHNDLLSKGICCPEPLLAAQGRDGAEIFAAAEVPYPTVYQLLLKKDSLTDCCNTLACAAKGIRKLHEAGFAHGDCLPGNMCIDDEERVYFLDNDRTSRPPAFLRARGKRRNLVQFLSHLGFMHSLQCGFAPFWDGYLGNDAPSSSTTERIEKIVKLRIEEIRDEYIQMHGHDRVQK